MNDEEEVEKLTDRYIELGYPYASGYQKAQLRFMIMEKHRAYLAYNANPSRETSWILSCHQTAVHQFTYRIVQEHFSKQYWRLT